MWHQICSKKTIQMCVPFSNKKLVFVSQLQTPPGMVTPTTPWAACFNASPHLSGKKFFLISNCLPTDCLLCKPCEENAASPIYALFGIFLFYQKAKSSRLMERKSATGLGNVDACALECVLWCCLWNSLQILSSSVVKKGWQVIYYRQR